MRSRLWNKLAEAMWDYLSRAVVGHIAPLLGFVVPIFLFWLANGVVFFTRPASVPGWLLVLGSSVLLASLAWCLATVLRERARPHKKYKWRGLEWALRAAFWGNFDHLRSEEVGWPFLKDMLGGPFCARCKRGVAVHLKGDGELCPPRP